MRSSFILRLFFAIPLFCLVFGCGGGGGSSQPGTGRAALEAASSKWDSIDKTFLDKALTEMSDWLKTQPQFSNVYISSDHVVWARLQDGRNAGWMDDRYLNGTGRATKLSRLVPQKSRNMPAGKIAYLFHCRLFSDDPSRQGADIRAQLEEMLKQAGYGVVSLTGRLEDYKSIDPQNFALLWTNSHGHFVKIKTNGVDQDTFVMASSNVAKGPDLDTSSPYYADQKNGRIVLLKNTDQEYFLWFSGAWLQANVQLGNGRDGVWINNSCASMQTNDFADAAFHAGLTNYVGWDEEVIWQIANAAALYLVDRMAGTNMKDPIPVPPQRPFDIIPIYNDMDGQSPRLTKSDLDVQWFLDHWSHHATLRMRTNPFSPQSGGEGFTGLAPSISYMGVTSRASNQTDLDIYGHFGERQGQVSVAGSQIGVLDWSTLHIRCSLPAHDQAGAYGDVVVDVDGHKSNPVPLTMWELTFDNTEDVTWSGQYVDHVDPISGYTYFGNPTGSLNIASRLKLWVRADIHGYRATPGQQQPFNTPDPNVLLSSSGHTSLDVKYTAITANGQAQTVYTSADPNYAPITLFNTFSSAISGGVPLDGSDSRASITNIYGQIFPTQHQLGIVWDVSVTSAIQVDISSQPPGAILGNMWPTDYGRAFSKPWLTLDDGFNVVAGSTQSTDDVPARGYSVTHKTSWSGIVYNAPAASTTRAGRR